MTLVASNAGGSNLCIFNQSTMQFDGGFGVASGDGVLCLGGSLKRLGARGAVGGTALLGFAAGDPAISLSVELNVSRTAYYQVRVRDANPTFCTPGPFGTFNWTNGIRIVWGP